MAIDTLVAEGTIETAPVKDIPEKDLYTIHVSAPTGLTAVSIDVYLGMFANKMKKVLTYVFDADDLSEGSALFSISGIPVRYIKTPLSVLTGGSSPVVDVKAGWHHEED